MGMEKDLWPVHGRRELQGEREMWTERRLESAGGDGR